MKGHELVVKEREEQLTKHGHTIADDVKYNSKEELLQASVAIIQQDTINFPFPESWDKEFEEKVAMKPRVEQLAIAGALICAQIDVDHELLEQEEKRWNDEQEKNN